MSTEEGRVRAPDSEVGTQRLRRRAPFSIVYVGPATAVFDLAIIVLTAIVSAAAYHALVHETDFNLAGYAAIGAVCFVNFALIAFARGAYQPDWLLLFRRQVREVTVTWAVAVTLSLGLAFAVNANADLSRGAVAFFLVTGLLALLAWRRVLTTWAARAIEDRVPGTRKVLLVADYEDLVRSDTARQMRDAGLMATEVQPAPLTTAERAVKRLFDVTLALAGLVLLSPLLAMVAVLVKLDSSGSAIIRQTRIGFSGRPFLIVKFRTMTVNDDGARQATFDDPRITRLGHLLRKTSIDELPQLWNVLKGDMSIVGPRPHVVAHDEMYRKLIGSYQFRQSVKPGITGWAQVHGLRGPTARLDHMAHRVEYDLYYANNYSLFLDVRILLLTVRLVWRDPTAF